MSPRKATLSNESAQLLIKAVRERPCIWNQEDKDYNGKFHTGSAWMEISNILELPEDYVRAKWKNLRDLFKREIRRTRPRSLESYKGKWRHFHYLWFLHRPSDSCPEVDTETFQETRNPFVKYERPDSDTSELDAYSYLNEDGNAEETVAPKKKKKSDDFDLMFLKSLTPFLKELEPMRKLVVRNKMHELLMNELAAQRSAEM